MPDASKPQRFATGRDPRRPALSILVAEDNEINALLARALLAQARPSSGGRGQRHGRARILSSARARRGTPYDLVLMDVRMPGIDGLEATRRIRAAEGEAARAHADHRAHRQCLPEDREACLAAGMDGFLAKPLDREQLALRCWRPPSRCSRPTMRRVTAA